MSGLIPYLENILYPLPGSTLLPTALGNDMFSDCTVVSNCTQVEVEKIIEFKINPSSNQAHVWALLYLVCDDAKKQAFRMLHRGEQAYRLAILTFFLL